MLDLEFGYGLGVMKTDIYRRWDCHADVLPGQNLEFRGKSGAYSRCEEGRVRQNHQARP